MPRNRYPTQRPPAAAQVVRYQQPAQPQVVLVTERQMAAYEAEQQALRARWKARQDAIKARDAKVRQFWLGFGAVIALVLLTALVVAGWLLWTAVGLGVLALPVVLVLSVAVTAAGHRCVTVVQHWH